MTSVFIHICKLISVDFMWQITTAFSNSQTFIVNARNVLLRFSSLLFFYSSSSIYLSLSRSLAFSFSFISIRYAALYCLRVNFFLFVYRSKKYKRKEKVVAKCLRISLYIFFHTKRGYIVECLSVFIRWLRRTQTKIDFSALNSCSLIITIEKKFWQERVRGKI